MEVTHNPISITTIFESFTQDFITFFMYSGWIVGLVFLATFIILHIVRKQKNASKKELLIYKIFIVISILIILANIALWGIVFYALSTLDLSFLSVTELM